MPLLLVANLANTFTINRVEDDGDPYPPSALSSSLDGELLHYKSRSLGRGH
jgi:hypothetical protein